MNAKSARLVSGLLGQLELTNDTKQVLELMAEAIFNQGYLQHAEETKEMLRNLKEKNIRIIRGEK